MNDINSIFEAAGFLFGSERDEDKLYDESEAVFNNDILNFLEPLINYTSNDSYISDTGISSDQSCLPTTDDDLDKVSIDQALLGDVDGDDVGSSISSATTFASDQPKHCKSNVFADDTSSIKSPLSSDDGYVKEEVMTIDGDESNSANDFFILSEDGDFDYASPSPILLSYPESRTLKLVSPNVRIGGKRMRNSSASIRALKIKAIRKRNSDESASDKDTSDDSSSHPRLRLTPEEQKLARKEGIILPSYYPLTKAQERDLKRIRRKIRNKISAQDSRRRKKEYVDSLEEKVRRTSEENDNLIKRIKTLESQRLTLSTQVRKLQAVLARSTSAQSTQPSSTCLLVLIMSMALLLAPNLRNSSLGKENNEDEGISLSEDGTTPSLNGVRTAPKNLLFSHKAHEGQCNIEEETKTLTEQLKGMQLPDAKILSGLLEMMKTKINKEDSLFPNDHDYFRPRKRTASEANDVRPDDLLSIATSLPVSKILKNSQNFVDNLLTTTTVMNQNNILNGLDALMSHEPITVIDLLSD